MGRKHFGGDLSGRWILTSGLGGMGGAQPLAASLAGAASLSIECQQSRIEKRLETRYLDVAVDTLDDAMLLIEEAVEQKRPLSVGLLGNAARSEEHTSELQSLMRISYAVFCLKKKKKTI